MRDLCTLWDVVTTCMQGQHAKALGRVLSKDIMETS